jgi:hypothetical protein
MNKGTTRRSPLLIHFINAVIYFIIGISVAACKYEAAEQVEAGQESISQESDTQTSDTQEENNSDNSENSELVLPVLTQCDGECTCDEVLVRFNDTGVVKSGESSTANLSYCSASILPDQDCSHGRDSQAILNKIGAGNAGFDFSKVSIFGGVLANNASEWHCVLDNHTGLLWEVKQDSFSREIGNKTNTFSWFSDELIDYSTVNNGNCNLLTSCDTESYIQAVNANQMCGYNDWRLPDRIELQGLVDYGNVLPSIDNSFFPHTTPGFYWTSSIDTDDLGSVWQVGFYHGRVGGSTTEQPRYIRLVRGHQKKIVDMPTVSVEEQNITLRKILAPSHTCNSQAQSSAPIGRFKQDNQGNILDSYSGLIWKRCVAGLSGSLCNEGQYSKMSWSKALSYAEQVNNDETQVLSSSWRLPNIKELQSTIETQCEEPALNPFVFPNMPLEDVWSATPHTDYIDSSYYVQYQNSIVFFGAREDELLVHLVRDCQ